MASVWEELKRRNVVKVAIAYAIVAWLLIEISATLLPAFEAPDWILRVVILLIGIGFVLALILSWAFELTPQGVVRTEDVPESDSVTKVTGQKLNTVIIAALVLALGFVVVDNYVLDGSERVAAHDEVPTAEKTSDVLPNSVAVLLCDNLSPNEDDAYFAASIHEEILNQLVKIRALNVIARTSVMKYANSDLGIPEIAAELNVGSVMECSVRFAGSAIMVTAQLIDPTTDLHLWSDTYPGDLSDLSTVFAMQADIATNIAVALEAELSTEEQANIEKIPTESPAAYALYLKALANFTLGRDTWQPEIEQALAIDPDFALAHAANAFLNAFYFGFETRTEELEQSVLQSAERALSLDPTLGTAYVAIAYVHMANWRLTEAKQAFERGIELDPNEPEILNAYGRFLRNVGEYRESARVGQRAVELDPNNSLFIYQLGINLRYARDFDAAYSVFQDALEFDPAAFNTHMQIAFTEISRGNREEALRELEIAEQLYNGTTLDRYRIAQFAFAYAQFDRHEDVARMVNLYEELTPDDLEDNGLWAMMYLAQGDHEQAYSRLERAIEVQDLNIFTLAEIKANAYQMSVLDEPRFQRLRDRIGALD